jgi:hypothetical protein
MTVNEAVPLRSTIHARLDRLRWSPFHTRMVAGLGAAWILDLRHGRSEADDRGDLPDLRRVVDDQRVAVRGRQAQRDHADLRVGRDLLLRVRGSERGLSDGQ